MCLSRRFGTLQPRDVNYNAVNTCTSQIGYRNSREIPAKFLSRLDCECITESVDMDDLKALCDNLLSAGGDMYDEPVHISMTSSL